MGWWAYGRYKLRLTEREFWNITPAQYLALKQQADNEDRMGDSRAALICTLVNNAFFKDKKSIDDFRLIAPEKRLADGANLIGKVKLLNARLGGTEYA